jgi:hypothetical protein
MSAALELPYDVAESVRLPSRFNGPPASANGGYAAGVAAALIGGPVEVTLRTPPPLDAHIEVYRRPDGSVSLLHAGTPVADAHPVDPLAFEPIVRPSLAEAAAASRGFAGRDPALHPLCDCYVCGPLRTDGLHVHPGPLPRDPRVGASLFAVPEDAPHDAGGRLAPEIVWAALDCPSYAPAMWREPLALLGRMTAEVLERPRVGDLLVAVGWEHGREGRKRHTASALLDADGRTVARARATWIQLRPEPLHAA